MRQERAIGDVTYSTRRRECHMPKNIATQNSSRLQHGFAEGPVLTEGQLCYSTQNGAAVVPCCMQETVSPLTSTCDGPTCTGMGNSFRHCPRPRTVPRICTASASTACAGLHLHWSAPHYEAEQNPIYLAGCLQPHVPFLMCISVLGLPSALAAPTVLTTTSVQCLSQMVNTVLHPPVSELPGIYQTHGDVA